MNLQESVNLLKRLRAEAPELIAPNNLRDFRNEGKWRVDANLPNTGEPIRFRSVDEYEKYLKVRITNG